MKYKRSGLVVSSSMQLSLGIYKHVVTGVNMINLG